MWRSGSLSVTESTPEEERKMFGPQLGWLWNIHVIYIAVIMAANEKQLATLALTNKMQRSQN